jgi:hypothetical protein
MYFQVLADFVLKKIRLQVTLRLTCQFALQQAELDGGLGRKYQCTQRELLDDYMG